MSSATPTKAYSVWTRDAELDEMYSSLFRELLTYMMEDPRSIGSCTHLLFMAKNIERIGDHATNIAENLYYLVNGAPLEQVRPKGDVSSLDGGNPGRYPKMTKPLVLIVEDEAPLVTLLRYNLEKEGFLVCEAGDGEEALVQIARTQARPRAARTGCCRWSPGSKSAAASGGLGRPVRCR